VEEAPFKKHDRKKFNLIPSSKKLQLSFDPLSALASDQEAMNTALDSLSVKWTFNQKQVYHRPMFGVRFIQHTH
jgi:hypothetical protein